MAAPSQLQSTLFLFFASLAFGNTLPIALGQPPQSAAPSASPQPVRSPSQPGTTPTLPAPTAAPTMRAEAIPDVSIKTLAFSYVGKFLAAGSADHTIKVLNSTQGRPLQTLAAHTAPVQALHFTTDGKVLLSAAKEINRWDVTNWQLTDTIPLEKWSWPYKVRFSPDGRRLAMTGSTADRSQGKLFIYDTASGLQLDDIEVTGMPSAVEFRPDSKTIAVGTIATGGGESRGAIHLFDVAAGRLQRTIDIHPASASAIAFAPDGVTLAYSAFQKAVVININNNGSRLVKELAGPIGPIETLAFSPDGRMLAGGGEGPELRMPTQWMSMSETRLWDLKTGRITWANVGDVGRATCVVFSPDGQQLARCDDGGIATRSFNNELSGWARYFKHGLGLGDHVSRSQRLRQEESMRRGNNAPPATPADPSGTEGGPLGAPREVK
jgi:WD40 repeat protein